jgi:hypothetical protein
MTPDEHAGKAERLARHAEHLADCGELYEAIAYARIAGVHVQLAAFKAGHA